MNKDSETTKYPDLTEFYRRKEVHRKSAARRPVAEKIETVARLRQFQELPADIRKENKAKRAAKKIQLTIKTR